MVDTNKYIKTALLVPILISVTAAPCLYLNNLKDNGNISSNSNILSLCIKDSLTTAILNFDAQYNRKSASPKVSVILSGILSQSLSGHNSFKFIESNELFSITLNTAKPHSLTSLYCLLTI